MKAVVFHDVGDIRLDDVPEPELAEATDAIVRITMSAICGTDLHFVRGTMPGAEDPVETLVRLTGGIGVDRAIDAVGVDAEQPHAGPGANDRETRERLGAERDEIVEESGEHGARWRPGDAPSQALVWAVDALAKAGTLAIVGVYPPADRFFPIGQAMNKNLTIRMGNCNHRKYIPELVDMVASGVIDPRAVLTQHGELVSAIDAYEHFDKREKRWIKVALAA